MDNLLEPERKVMKIDDETLKECNTLQQSSKDLMEEARSGTAEEEVVPGD